MDDFYRIPKSKCYMMLTRPTNGNKTRPDESSKKVESLTKKDANILQVLSSPLDEKTPESSALKMECSSDVENPPREKMVTRKRRRKANEKRERSKKKSNRSYEEKEKNCPEYSSNVPEETEIPENRIEVESKNDQDTEKCVAELFGDESKITEEKSDEVASKDDSKNLEKKSGEKKSSSMPYECKPCGYEFSRKWKYERHMNTHTRKKAEPVNFECVPCGKNFTRPSAYKQHMLKHSTEKPHKCDVCDKAFKRAYELKMHREIHSGSMYTCDICSFTTAYKVSLMVHKKRVHQKIYRHKCDKCDKAFMSKHELEDHRTCHLGTKSFICEICGNGFLQRSYLVHHKRVVHGVHNRAPMELKCEMCDKTFATKYCLQNHVGIHSQKFLCSQCGKEFATNYSLRMHNRMHTGERPHKCNMCSKSFARSNALAVHKLTHTGQRPYVCDICDKSFTQRTTMMAHRRKHPGSHPPPPRTSLVELVNAGDSNS